MGTGLFIIDAIIIAIVILPFVLFINGSNKRKRKLRKALQTEALQNHCNITKVEVHGNFALGIDAEQLKLFFYKENEETASTKIIDLNAITSCKFIKETRRIKDKKKHYDVIDRVLLSFNHRNNTDETNLELYSNNDDMSLNGEIVVAQKWQDSINELLNLNVANSTIEQKEQVGVAMS